jgi:pantetheine-phosphate adenylyltransferase
MSVGAMYPGTFDPITNGHVDLVRRAAKLFDRVVVAVAASPNKAPMFTLEERIGMARTALGDVPNIVVDGYNGLTVDYVRQHGLKVIIRGLRAVSDFEYEFQLAGMNRTLAPGVETLFLTPSDRYLFLSATIVREIAVLGGDIATFVHPITANRIRDKIGRSAAAE